MTEFLVPLSSTEATDSVRFGPKAANLAALSQKGLPTPGGYGLDAEAYRRQLRSLGLAGVARRVFAGDPSIARRAALQMRLTLMEGALDSEVEATLTTVWQKLADTRPVVRSSALVEDRAEHVLAHICGVVSGNATELILESRLELVLRLGAACE